MITREPAEAWATVEQADKLRRVQSRPKSAVGRVGGAKKGKGAVVGQRGIAAPIHNLTIVSVDLNNWLIATAMNVSGGVRRTLYFRYEEIDFPC